MKTLIHSCCLLGLGCAVAACGGAEVRVFEVTVKPVRSCHPAGVIPELCEDRSTLEGKSRTARLYLESRGPNQFIRYEEDGRAVTGNMEREGFLELDLVENGDPPVRRQYFHGSMTRGERTEDGCEKQVEHTVKFRLERDVRPPDPGEKPNPVRIVGNVQDRANQSEECGYATRSRAEEAFEGTEVEPGQSFGPFPAPAPVSTLSASPALP